MGYITPSSLKQGQFSPIYYNFKSLIFYSVLKIELLLHINNAHIWKIYYSFFCLFIQYEYSVFKFYCQFIVRLAAAPLSSMGSIFEGVKRAEK